MVQLLEYSPQLREQVEQEIDDLLAGVERRETIQPHIEISIPWNLRVSPAHASMRQIALATLDIALWVFALDDYTNDDYDQFFDQCLSTFDHDAAEGTHGHHPTAFSIHHFHMRAGGCSMNRYRTSRRNIADAYRRRNRLARGETSVRFDEYLEWRRILIGTRVWLSAWEVIGDFWLPDEIYEAAPIQATLDSLIYGQILENEIHSLPRDIAAGTPNLVLMHASEEGLSIETSMGELHRRFKQNEGIYRAAKANAQAAFADDPRVASLLEMTELCLEGSAALYQLNLSRYEAPVT